MAIMTPQAQSGFRMFLKPLTLNDNLKRALSFHAPLASTLDAQGAGASTAGTYTRASVASYPVNSSTVTKVTSGTARYETNGLLIEGARTNTILQSEALATTWTLVGPVVGAPTITSNQVAAPDGTLTADKVDLPAVTGSDYSYVQQGWAGTAASWTQSIYLRGAVGGEEIYISATPDGVSYGRVRCVLTTAWQRFSWTGTLTATTWYYQIGCDLRDASQTAISACTVYAWGAQAELGAFMSSYIPTTTITVTRARDALTFPSSGNLPDTGPGTSRIEVDTYRITTAQTFLDTRDSSNQQGVTMSMESDSDPFSDMVTTTSQAALAPTTDDFVANTIKKMALAWNTNDVELYTGGTSRATDTSATLPSGHTAIALGADGAGAVPAYGHFKNVTTFLRRLSSFEVANLWL